MLPHNNNSPNYDSVNCSLSSYSMGSVSGSTVHITNIGMQLLWITWQCVAVKMRSTEASSRRSIRFHAHSAKLLPTIFGL